MIPLKKDRVIAFLRAHWPSYLAGFLFMFLASWVQTRFPDILGQTIDVLRKPSFAPGEIYTRIAQLLLISLATFILTYLWRHFVIGNARQLECDLREQLYRHMQTLPQSFYTKNKTGDLIAYGINDISAVRMAIGPAAAQAVNGIFVCVVAIWSMFAEVSVRLSLLSLSPVPLVFVVMIIVSRQVRHRFLRVQQLFAAISDRVQENISGTRVIKAFAHEQQETGAFEILSSQMTHAGIRLTRTTSLLTPLIETCFAVSFVISLILGGRMVLAGQVSLGAFVAFNSYLAMVMSPIVSIGRVVTYFQRGAASMKRLSDIFSQETDILDGPELPETPPDGHVTFRDLTFTYPGAVRPALSGVTLDIPSGATIGIVGRSGCGKTTLANLLLRLYNPPEGSLMLDNRDILNYTVDTVRSSVASVPQDTFLFSTTIAENVRAFKDIYTVDDVETATRFSNIFDSICGFPDGFETLLGERGVNLSGGQKQRLSIARAIIRDPAVLILDDALSAVDTITERYILKNFRKYRQGRTTLIISHRVSAVERCDRIVVLRDGAIAETGSHDALLAERGLYYDIWLEQSKDSKKLRAKE